LVPEKENVKMNKPGGSIKWLAWSMGLALLGIMAIQVYWINRAVELKRTHFENQVSEALIATVTSIEKKETLRAFSRIIPGNEAYQSGKNFLYQLQDTLCPEHGMDTKSAFYHFDSLGRSTVTLDSSSKVFQFEYADGTVENVQVDRMKVMQKFEQVGSFVNDIMVEMMATPIDIEDRVSAEVIEETLKEQLIKRGINTQFHYAVLDKSGDEPLMSTAFNPEVLSYKAQLFPNDFFRSASYLLVQFPEKSSYIFRSVTGIVLLSMVFTFIIIFSFYKTLNMALRQKQLAQVKSDFINNMTHEFKTPIATISLASDALVNPMVLEHPDRIRHFIQVIKEENRRMNNQVEQILQMSVLEKNELQLKRQAVDLCDVVSDAVESMRLMVENKEGTLQFKCEAPELIAVLDKTHFSNSILNLLDNAIKYSPEKPQITVRLYREGNKAHIAVTDRGMGMSKEAQKRIFDRFYRVYSGDRHDIKGHGLGLSYVMEILKLHDGEVQVHSELGKGSQFTLLIPITHE
jgi:signal transduction histidine kinase